MIPLAIVAWATPVVILLFAGWLLSCGFPGKSSTWETIKFIAACIAWPVTVPYWWIKGP